MLPGLQQLFDTPNRQIEGDFEVDDLLRHVPIACAGQHCLNDREGDAAPDNQENQNIEMDLAGLPAISARSSVNVYGPDAEQSDYKLRELSIYLMREGFMKQSVALGLMVILLACNFASSSQVLEEQIRVSDLTIRGLRTVPIEEVQKHLTLRPGAAFDGRNAINDLKRLMDTGLFDKYESKVVIEADARGKVDVTYLLQESR